MKWNEVHLFDSETAERSLRKIGLPEKTVLAMTEQAWRNWSSKNFRNWCGTAQFRDGKRVYETYPVKNIVRVSQITDAKVFHILAL